jgi:hypothetical protein
MARDLGHIVSVLPSRGKEEEAKRKWPRLGELLTRLLRTCFTAWTLSSRHLIDSQLRIHTRSGRHLTFSVSLELRRLPMPPN